MIPQDIIDNYNLMDKQTKGFLYVRAEKGMYGLVQAGIISNTALKGNLRPFGYEHVPITLLLWWHNKNKITFTLVVNGFGIRYQRREDDQHFINSLEDKYEVMQDWTRSLSSGITLN